MSTFLENNTNGITPNGIAFINLIPHLEELFTNTPITLFAKEKLDIADVKFTGHFQPFVFMDNEIIECNFRMIESYLPEILYAISLASNPEKSINESIQYLSKKKIPLPRPSFSKIFLTHKMMRLFEVMLFADIFNGVWNGETIDGICYVHKENNELSYYQNYQIRSLLIKLLDKITISASYWASNDKQYCRILFRLEK